MGQALTQARAIIRYLQGLTLSGGDHDGGRFKVLAWERRFILGAFGADGDSALSVGRGNGKSCLVSGLACCVVDPSGPLHGNRRHVDVFASSFGQSLTIFEDALRFLGDRHELGDRKTWKKHNSVNHALLEHKPTGARLTCHGCDPARAHGLRSYLALLDEPAQWQASLRDRMYAAIRTGLGKVPDSRLIALGTRPASADHWFAKMLSNGTYHQTYAAKKTDSPFFLRTWKKANPSLDHLPSLRKQIEREAKDAKGDGDLLAAFKSLRLNLGTSEINEAFLLEPDVWLGLEGDANTSGPFVLSFDLGTSEAMSCASAYFLNTRALDCVACWPELPSLEEREKKDATEEGLYRKMYERGEIIIAGRRVTDTGALVREAISRWGQPSAIVADRYKINELTQVLEAERVPVCNLIPRGQGFRDGSEDCRYFKKACLSGHGDGAAFTLTPRRDAELSNRFRPKWQHENCQAHGTHG